VAVIGSATAQRLRDRGVKVALVPPRFVAESLVEVFPAGSGRVLLARAAVARDVLPDGLRAKGWQVDVVEAYRTVQPPVDAALMSAVRSCDAVAFTSPSTVHNFLETFGLAAVPPVVACIGPVTAAACHDAGVDVSVEATRHTMDGLVDALVHYRNGFAPPSQSSTTN
jgi:uroporphyrinogen-III synthase